MNSGRGRRTLGTIFVIAAVAIALLLVGKDKFEEMIERMPPPRSSSLPAGARAAVSGKARFADGKPAGGVRVTVEWSEGAGDTHTGHTVCLDTDAEAIGRHGSARPDWRGATSELAYTIYTSGSTGKPKGVEVSHANVVNFLLSMAQTPGLRETDTLVAVTTLSFDIAVLELFLPLTTALVSVAISARLPVTHLFRMSS